jgi:hypothetical protein
LGGDGEDQDADWKLAGGDWQGGWGKWISILIKSFKVIVFEQVEAGPIVVVCSELS